MAESVCELPGAPSEVITSLISVLEAAGWQTLECHGPLLVVQRGRDDRAVLAILSSLHGSLVRIRGSRGAVAAVKALLPASAARPAPLISRERRTGVALLASLIIGTLVAVPLVAFSLWQAHHVGGPTVAPTPGVGAPSSAAAIAGAIGRQEPSPTPPPATPADLVREFYTLLDRKAFDVAYSLLSERYRRAWPFEAFRAGYGTTQGIRIDDVSQIDDSPQVRVSVSATDLVNGRPTVRRYEGQWFLVKENGQWHLDRGLIAPQP